MLTFSLSKIRYFYQALKDSHRMKGIGDLENLEMHVTHSCNLTCESCSHYSNHMHKGLLSLDDASVWMDKWNNKLNPKIFSLMGGEPTLHPQLTEFVILARKKMASCSSAHCYQWIFPSSPQRLATRIKI